MVILGRIQREVAEKFALLAEDPDIETAHEDDDSSALVPPAHTHAVEPRPMAQSEYALALRIADIA